MQYGGRIGVQIKEEPLTNAISVFINFPATFLRFSAFPNPITDFSETQRNFTLHYKSNNVIFNIPCNTIYTNLCIV